LLTDRGYSRRLRELMDNNPDFDLRDIDLLTIGRQFRLASGEKVIIGRDQKDNEKLLSMKRDDDIIIDIADYPSPIAMIPHGGSEEATKISASICVTHSDAPDDQEIKVTYHHGGDEQNIWVKAIPRNKLENIRIQ